MPAARHPAREGVAPRVANAVLGAWLVLSAVAWPRYGPEGFNALVTGLLLLTSAVVAVWAPRLRFGGAFLGAWLFVTTLFLVHAVRLSFFHDLGASVVMIALALVPSRPWEYRAGRVRA